MSFALCRVNALLWTLLCLLVSSPSASLAQAGSSNAFRWSPVEEGFEIARYELGQGFMVIKSEVLLLKFSPEKFSFLVARAEDLNQEQSDVRSLTKRLGGIAGINAHFFDPTGHALGLLIQNGREIQGMHKGGRLLTGVFSLKGNDAQIVHRDAFKNKKVDLAIQSGPRLLVDGKVRKILTSDVSSRRSGIAITKQGEIILFATMLRFPGASFRQLQEMLSDPTLDIEHALNLDGGGSSQLFVEKNKRVADETFIDGGDRVPVALVVKRKNRREK